MRRHLIPRFAAAAWLWGAAALTGCTSPPGSSSTQDGVLTLAVMPTVSAVSGLQLTSGRVQIDELTVLGDVAPDGRSMVSEFNLDLLSSTGASFTLSMLPQGVYSRVRFSVDSAVVMGSWRGTPFSVALETDDSVAAVDLRSNGVEVTPGHDGALTLGVDPGTWFAGNVLDGATPVSGQLTIDSSHNAAVAAQLTSRLAGSFTLQDSTTPVP